MAPIDRGFLHHTILTHFVERGYAPSVRELSGILEQPRDSVIAALEALQDDHGVVLQPVSREIWVAHPFSAAPTNFWVESRRGSWWGNCAWCSMGIAALVGGDVVVTTTLGGESRQVRVRVSDGATQDEYLVHFPVPMARAWENVTYTCSTMVLFDSEQAIADWCARHRIAKGDVQPISAVLDFATVWYGHHLDKNWRRLSAAEAKELFGRFQLSGPTWDIPPAATRF
jgi:hypothetical protein